MTQQTTLCENERRFTLGPRWSSSVTITRLAYDTSAITFYCGWSHISYDVCIYKRITGVIIKFSLIIACHKNIKIHQCVGIRGRRCSNVTLIFHLLHSNLVYLNTLGPKLCYKLITIIIFGLECNKYTRSMTKETSKSMIIHRENKLLDPMELHMGPKV